MTLEFNLPEEQQEANEAANVWRLTSAISQYSNRLRSLSKHSDNEEEMERAEWALKLLFEELEDVVNIFEL